MRLYTDVCVYTYGYIIELRKVVIYSPSDCRAEGGVVGRQELECKEDAKKKSKKSYLLFRSLGYRANYSERHVT